MNPTPIHYRSYLVRLWQEDSADGMQVWRVEIEHIQTGACLQFPTLEELWRYLHWQTRQGGDDEADIPDTQ